MENKGVNLLCYKQYCSNGHLYEGFQHVNYIQTARAEDCICCACLEATKGADVNFARLQNFIG